MRKTLQYLKTLVTVSVIFMILGATGMGTMQVKAAGNSTAITACAITGDKVSVIASTAQLPASDDGVFYLFAEPTYSGGITTNYVAASPMAGAVSFSAPLNVRKANSLLYDKFIVAVKRGGQFVPVSEACYLTNPEAVATCTTPRTVPASKKGLLPDPAIIAGPELKNLGVKQATFNISISDILGPTSNGSYPTINYNYNGKNYQFNGLKIAEYDHVFGILSKQGICTTAVLLNNFTGAHPELLHPYARDGFVAPYYAFNTAEPAGVDTLAAAGSFLAQRYSNKGHGKVDNWVIGNEVTARTQWNYMQDVGMQIYVEEYAKAVRLFYTALKSENGNANIYVSIDQQWDRNRGDRANYDGKDLLIAFNAAIAGRGNIDWGVACHPYPVPLTWASFWNGQAYYRNLVKHAENSPFLTMENVEVLTDFMCKPAMWSPYGQVRSIIITEVGYTSAQGEPVQAAAMMQAYYAAVNNQHIDAINFTRQTDSPAEIAAGIATGLTGVNGQHKLAYEYFKNMDTPNAAPYIEAAKGVIGIGSWNQSISPR
ncbi:MAG: DUF5722 domain-containing protein [Lachnospiraceae bacterium]